MIDKFCEYLTNKIRKNMPEVDDERAEVIKYGLQLLVGEVPKIFIMMGIAWALGILKLTLICFCMMLPYRMYSGGFHLKTHLGCIIGTSIMYTGNAFVSQLLVIPVMWKIVVSVILWVFAIIMIYLYAPADTEDVPVIAKRERKKRKVISYVVVSVMLVCGCVVQNAVISNMLIVGVLLQSCSISRLAYRVTGNRFGYEVYYEEC